MQLGLADELGGLVVLDPDENRLVVLVTDIMQLLFQRLLLEVLRDELVLARVRALDLFPILLLLIQNMLHRLNLHLLSFLRNTELVVQGVSMADLPRARRHGVVRAIRKGQLDLTVLFHLETSAVF